MSDDFVRIPPAESAPLDTGDGGIDGAALASALRAQIENIEQLTEAVSVTSRYSWEIPLLVDVLMDRVTGLAQAAWLVDLDTSYKVAYSDLGRKRMAWANDMENNENNNHENNDQLCEGES